MDDRLTTAQSVKRGDFEREAGLERQVIGWDRGRLARNEREARTKWLRAALVLANPFRSKDEAAVLTKVRENPLGNFLVVVPGTGDFQNCHVWKFEPATHYILRGAFVPDGNKPANDRNRARSNVAKFLTVSYLEEIIRVSPVSIDRPGAREVKRIGADV